MSARSRQPPGTSRNPGGIVVVLLIMAMLSGPEGTAAHDAHSESVMNAFVKVEPDRAHLVIRVPLVLLGSVGFPTTATRELDLARAGSVTQRALSAIHQGITIRENDSRLTPSESVGRLTLPSDRSFQDYDKAVSHIASPVAAGTAVYADQAFFDAHFTYPINSPTSDFSVETTMTGEPDDSLRLALHFMPLEGSTRAYELTSGSGRVALDPGWYEASRMFLRLGVQHILGGIDHLLFLMCLIIPFRRLSSLLPVVTSFTVPHSVTLIAAAYGGGAGRELVFSAHRDLGRSLHCVYGIGEYLRRQPAPALVDYRCLWTRPRLWLFFRVAPGLPIRRLTPPVVTAIVQCGRRARANRGSSDCGLRAECAVHVRFTRAPRGHHPVGDACAHRMALDGRSSR